MNARVRGQNLTLLALTMLIVTLMVLITLGISQRIRENHELNNLADAAAYSSAVVNARAYNNIAIINRLQVSYWVSMTANESLISWTTYARALWIASYQTLDNISNGWDPLWVPATDCDRVRADAENASRDIKADFWPAWTNWREADQKAGAETLSIQGMIAGLRAETRGMPSDGTSFPDGMRDRLFTERLAQTVTKRILAEANLPGVSVVPLAGAAWPAGGAAGLSSREVGDYGLGLYADCTGNQSGLCLSSDRGNWSDAVVSAAMGTRGNPFVLSRGVMPALVAAEWTKLDLKYNSSIVMSGATPVGSGYFDRPMSHSGATSGTANGTYAWGDDHGTLTATVSRGSCTRTSSMAVTSHVKTTDLLNSEDPDEHKWEPNDFGIGADPAPFAEKYHTTSDCTPLCPSVWVRQVAFNPNDQEADAYGQPKAMVMLVRDQSQTNDKSQPWRLDFKFGFSSTGSRFDNRGQVLHGDSVGAGLNIKSQTAVATGMAYYHRKDQWLEYPNLLNPFWRATLVPADIDESGNPRRGGTDMDNVLFRASESWQDDAYKQLMLAGYRGVH